MQNQTEKLRALLETTKAITTELDLNEVLNLILQRGKELTQADTGALLLVDKDQKLWTKILIGPHREDEYRHTIAEGITGWVARNKKPCLVPDVSSDERYIEYTSETKSELAVPMLYGENLIGVLNVESSKLDAFKESDCEQLTALAGQAVIAIENARLYEELNKQVKTINKQVKTIESLHKVGAKITANIELIPILREITKGLNKIVEADIPLVYLYDQEKDEFTDIYYGDVSEEWTECKPRKDGGGFEAIKEKNILVVHEDDKKGPGISVFAKKKGVKTTIAIPLIFGEVALGAMYLHFLGERHPLEDGEKKDLDSLAIRTSTVIKNIMEEIGFYPGSNEKMVELKEKIAEKIDKEEIVEKIDKLTKADILLMYLYDQEKEELRDIIFAGLSKEWGAKCKPRERGAGKTAIKIRGLVTAYEDTYPDINPYPKQKGAKTTAAYPLIFEDKTLGVFFMHFLERHEFTEEEEKAIAALGAHAAIALERVKTYQDFRVLAEFGKEVTADLSLKATAECIAKAIERIIGGGIPNIFLYDSKNESFEFLACSGAQEELFLGSIIPRKKVGLGARVIEKVKKGEVPDYIVIEDVQNDPKNQNPSPSAKAHDIKTSACFPLKFGNKPLGVLYLHFKNKRKFSSDDKLKLSMLTDQMAIAINNADQYATQMAIQKEIPERLTPEETINTNLEILFAANYSLSDLAYGLCDVKELEEYVKELEELFQRLFNFVDKIIISPLIPGFSGARVVKVQPLGLPYAVVKFGERGKISEEAKRFDDEVFGKIGLYRITFKMKHCSTPNIGGIFYTLIGTSVDEVRSFNAYYHDSSLDVERIQKVIEGLFTEVLGLWFNKKTEQGIDLTDWYQKHLGIDLQTLRKDIFTGNLTGEDKVVIDFGNCGKFPNPVNYVMDRKFPFDTFFCPIHGDLNGNNILIDPSGYAWLIDFAKTGQGYVFQDFIKLECVIKLELLQTDDVQALCEFEEALLSPKKFSEFTTMSFSNSDNKDDLEKGFAVIKKLRELVWDVSRPQDKSAKEYYVGLLYQTLSTLRRTDVRRQHAFLSASMICDTLDKMP